MKYGYIFLFFILIEGCRSFVGEEIPQLNLEPEYYFEELSDSSLFSDVRAMGWFDDHLIFTDYYRSQMIICDDSGKIEHIIGNKGKGPGGDDRC